MDPYQPQSQPQPPHMHRPNHYPHHAHHPDPYSMYNANSVRHNSSYPPHQSHLTHPPHLSRHNSYDPYHQPLPQQNSQSDLQSIPMIPPLSSLSSSIMMQSMPHIYESATYPHTHLPPHPQSPIRHRRDSDDDNHNFPELSFQSPLTRLAHHPPSSDDDSGIDDNDKTINSSGKRRYFFSSHKRTASTCNDNNSSNRSQILPLESAGKKQLIADVTVDGTEAAEKIDEENIPILPLPEHFEEPQIQHRLDIRWETCFYKSLNHCATSRRRYMARCKYCNYEMEGRPERLERHVLLLCKKVPEKVKVNYKEMIQKQGKLTVSEEEMAAKKSTVLTSTVSGSKRKRSTVNEATTTIDLLTENATSNLSPELQDVPSKPTNISQAVGTVTSPFDIRQMLLFPRTPSTGEKRMNASDKAISHTAGTDMLFDAEDLPHGTMSIGVGAEVAMTHASTNTLVQYEYGTTSTMTEGMADSTAVQTDNDLFEAATTAAAILVDTSTNTEGLEFELFSVNNPLSFSYLNALTSPVVLNANNPTSGLLHNQTNPSTISFQPQYSNSVPFAEKTFRDNVSSSRFSFQHVVPSDMNNSMNYNHNVYTNISHPPSYPDNLFSSYASNSAVNDTNSHSRAQIFANEIFPISMTKMLMVPPVATSFEEEVFLYFAKEIFFQTKDSISSLRNLLPMCHHLLPKELPSFFVDGLLQPLTSPTSLITSFSRRNLLNQSISAIHKVLRTCNDCNTANTLICSVNEGSNSINLCVSTVFGVQFLRHVRLLDSEINLSTASPMDIAWKILAEEPWKLNENVFSAVLWSNDALTNLPQNANNLLVRPSFSSVKSKALEELFQTALSVDLLQRIVNLWSLLSSSAHLRKYFQQHLSLLSVDVFSLLSIEMSAFFNHSYESILSQNSFSRCDGTTWLQLNVATEIIVRYLMELLRNSSPLSLGENMGMNKQLEWEMNKLKTILVVEGNNMFEPLFAVNKWIFETPKQSFLHQAILQSNHTIYFSDILGYLFAQSSSVKDSNSPCLWQSIIDKVWFDYLGNKIWQGLTLATLYFLAAGLSPEQQILLFHSIAAAGVDMTEILKNLYECFHSKDNVIDLRTQLQNEHKLYVQQQLFTDDVNGTITSDSANKSGKVDSKALQVRSVKRWLYHRKFQSKPSLLSQLATTVLTLPMDVSPQITSNLSVLFSKRDQINHHHTSPVGGMTEAEEMLLLGHGMNLTSSTLLFSSHCSRSTGTDSSAMLKILVSHCFSSDLFGWSSMQQAQKWVLTVELRSQTDNIQWNDTKESELWKLPEDVVESFTSMVLL